MKSPHFKHEVVGSIPEVLQPNTLYVAAEGDVAGHLCACGCGREVFTPLSPTDWSVSFDRRGASLSPSIGNWAFPCRSHYFIWNGAVVWAGDMSDRAIAQGRGRDRARKNRYYERLGAPAKGNQPTTPLAPPRCRSIWEKLLAWGRRLFAL